MCSFFHTGRWSFSFFCSRSFCTRLLPSSGFQAFLLCLLVFDSRTALLIICALFSSSCCPLGFPNKTDSIKKIESLLCQTSNTPHSHIFVFLSLCADPVTELNVVLFFFSRSNYFCIRIFNSNQTLIFAILILTLNPIGTEQFPVRPIESGFHQSGRDKSNTLI